MAEYLIKGNTLTTWANHARRISETTDTLNAAEITEIFSRTQGECLNEPIEVDEPSNTDSSVYLIQDDTMNILADNARRISGTDNNVSGEDITNIFARTQGVLNTNGKYLVEAKKADYYVKSGMYDTGEVFAMPELGSKDKLATTSSYQGHVYIAEAQKWVSTAPITHGYTVVEDMPITAQTVYKPIDDSFTIVLEIENENTVVTFNMYCTDTYVVNWGDGSVDSGDASIDGVVKEAHTHTYANVGTYIVQIPKGDRIQIVSSICGNDSTKQMVKAIAVPKWLSDNTDCLWDYAFNGLVNLEYILFEDGVKFRSDFSLAGAPSLVSIYTNTICEAMFVGTGIESAVIPYGTTELPSFYGCSNLKKIVVPKGITSVEDGSFGYCSNLTTVHLPCTITSIGNGAFQYATNLQEITGLDNVISIGKEAFAMGTQSNYTLTKLVLPSITSIGDSAFVGLAGLKTIVLPMNNICTCGFAPFSSYPNIYVPDDLVDSYKTAENWSVYAYQIKPLSEYASE